VRAQRIVFACFGSLGDLHPYIAIAKALIGRGHRPLIASMDRNRAAVTAEGVDFAPMRPSEAQMGDPAEAVRRLIDPIRGPEYLIRNLVLPHLRESYDDLAAAAGDADIIVSHPLAFAAPLLAEKRGLAWASTVLSPFSMMSAIDPPLFPAVPFLRWVRRLGVAPYRALFSLLKLPVARWERPIAELRAELALPPSDKQALFEGQFSPRLNLALFPPFLAPPRKDWPPATQQCGFARHDGAPADPDTMARLEAFLAAGEPPIVFTLGSSIALQPGNFAAAAIEAARRLGRRAILVLPGAAQGGAPDENGIARFDYLPYSTVFPRAAANVHPGGIGTLSQALVAGRPQLVLPAAFDQPDNARRAEELGVARTLPWRHADTASLASVLSELLGSARHAQAARAAVSPAATDGAKRAAELLIALA
jgi:rhamnosyltransferase subunit B